MPPQRPSRFHRALQDGTLLLMFFTKLAGLIAGVDNLIFVPHPTAPALLVSGLMIAGGQLSEGLIIAVIDRIMGSVPKPPELPVPVPAPVQPDPPAET